ncbi:MAG: hypothetical protein JO247_13495 [Chloroflexi bacterium]|nr:hypothetical protein [Chloroflexota bacterium]
MRGDGGIAIVGLGCLFPGAGTPDQFWRNLLDGVDCTSEATRTDLSVDPDLLFDPAAGVPDKAYWLRGGYVRGFELDPTGFALPSQAIAGLDRPAQWALHVAREALRDAGSWGAPVGRAGCVLGNLSFPTKASHAIYDELYAAGIEAALGELLERPDLRLPRLPRHQARGADALLSETPAGILANELGLDGPSFCLDAACASSLYAVKLACDYLLAGEADLMLAGAVSCADPFFITQGFSLFRAYPNGGSSHPLDAGSGGLMSGEGAGLFVLKREADALRDGDRIHAVVRGAGLSNDGRGKHPLTPNSKGQVMAMQRAYTQAGLDPTDVDYVECHATGTLLGDPVELESMSVVFSGSSPLIGSVKSNVGHLLTAAGMAGMTKVILAMANGVIPPTVGVRQPISSRDERIGGDRVVREATAWSIQRAAISAFGFGGTNAHLLLDPGGPSAGSPPPVERCRLSITGMGAHFGECAGLDAVGRALRDGEPRLRPVPAERWKGLGSQAPWGAYVDGFDFDFLRFGIPPHGDSQAIPQQLLLLSVADEAIRDAELAAGSNTAVIVAMSTELELHRYRGRVDLGWQIPEALARAGVALEPEKLAALTAIAKDSLLKAASVNQYVSFIGNIMASRVAAQWDFSGPAFTISAGAESAARALDVAQLLLSRGEIQAAVVAAVDLNASLESVAFRDSGRPVGEGAAAIVVAPEDIAGNAYAAIDDISSDGDAERVFGDTGVAAGLLSLVDGVLRTSDRRPSPSVEGERTGRVVLGGRPVREVIVTEENIRRFRPRVSEPARVPVAAGAGSTALIDMEQAYLTLRHKVAVDMGAVIEQQLDGLIAAPAPERVWDQADLLEFARGSIAAVFGDEYAVIDSYARRVRLPMPPYLLVSRVTRLNATRGVFEPSTLTTEYDIPHGSWYTVDGQIPWAVAVESGQCDLLLISYLGIDFENGGERVYRLLDCGLTFLAPMAMEGQTLRYDISINSFARSGDNLLFFFSYDCYADGQLALKMDGGCAGFFSDEELEHGRGVVYSDAELAERRDAIQRDFRPPLTCTRRSFERDDLQRLGRGELDEVFGRGHDKHGRNPALRLPPDAIRMLDRIVSVDPHGGPWGLGCVVAEKDLAPGDWYFPCHFKDDEVLAGSLMAEGCFQLLDFYLLFLGFHTRTVNARFQPVAGLRQSVRCRGQVTPKNTRLTYRLEVTDVGFKPQPYAVANVEIWAEDKMVVHFKDVGVRLAEEVRTDAPATRTPGVVCDEWQIEEFATGSISNCFGPDFAIYDGRSAPRQPNGDLKLISRIREIDGRRMELDAGARLVAEYDVPSDPWFYAENPAAEAPYSILMELGLQPCGFLSAWMGSTLVAPDQEWHFRNLDGRGELADLPDLRGRTVQNRVRLTSSVAMQGIVIQKFDYELSVGGRAFFRGDAAFGYFSPDALANQVGLDSGKRAAPWLETAAVSAIDVELTQERHVDLLDRVRIVRDGGNYGQGYAFAEKAVDPFDWFYANHFYQDPVMPGSLGVEAMLQALESLAVTLGLGAGPARQVTDHTTVWKYRGQIVPDHERMSLELHVTSVARAAGSVVITADGSLWRDVLRIYEVTDLALRLAEA